MEADVCNKYFAGTSATFKMIVVYNNGINTCTTNVLEHYRTGPKGAILESLESWVQGTKNIFCGKTYLGDCYRRKIGSKFDVKIDWMGDSEWFCLNGVKYLKAARVLAKSERLGWFYGKLCVML